MRTGNYNHTNIGKNGDISCKICQFINVYTKSLLKSSLFFSAYISVGELLQRQGHFWAWPLYILFKSDSRHRMHFLVFTDTDLYSLTMGKAYLANQRWRRSTCLWDQCYDIGCHPCIYLRMLYLVCDLLLCVHSSWETLSYRYFSLISLLLTYMCHCFCSNISSSYCQRVSLWSVIATILCYAH